MSKAPDKKALFVVSHALLAQLKASQPRMEVNWLQFVSIVEFRDQVVIAHDFMHQQ